MPNEIVVDLSHPSPQPTVRPMSAADAAALATTQAASQARDSADATRLAQIRAVLVAYMANATPTAADTVVALRNVIKVLARDL